MLNTGSKWDWSFSLGLEQTFHSPHSFSSLSFSIIWTLLTVLLSLLPCVIYFLFHSNQTLCHSAFTCGSWYLPWSMGKMLLARLHTSALSSSAVALPEAEFLLPVTQTQTWTQEAPQHSKEALPSLTTRHVTGHVVSSVWWKSAASFIY